jgi:hypothetical protein
MHVSLIASHLPYTINHSIMDRLYGTLDDKIDVWNSDLSMLKGCCGVTKNNPAVRDLLKDRLLVAYDLSSAFHYLHGFRYVQEKKSNMTVDCTGVCQSDCMFHLASTSCQTGISRYQTRYVLMQ